MKLLARSLLVAWLLVGPILAGPAESLDPNRNLLQYKHSRWTREDGAPHKIRALAQGREGYLWIGSAEGLHRFDGLRFEHIPLQGPAGQRSEIVSLLVTHDRSLWAGYSSGGISIYRNGQLRAASMPNPGSHYVLQLAQSSDRTMWVVLGRLDLPLLSFRSGRWTEYGVNAGLPREFVTNILTARDGSLWAATMTSVYVLRKGATRFQRVDVRREGMGALAEDSIGRIWVSDDAGTRAIYSPVRSEQRALGRVDYQTPKQGRGPLTFFDRNGNLWGKSEGVFRLRFPVAGGPPSRAQGALQVEQFRASHGLTSDRTSPIIEDREGNVWVGTDFGLDRFREANVVVEPGLTDVPATGIEVFGASDGTVYVGLASAVHKVVPGGRPEALLQGVPGTEAICEGHDGTVYVVLEDRLVEVRAGKVTTTKWPHQTYTSIAACAADRSRALWMAAGSNGFFRRHAGAIDNVMVPTGDQPRPTRIIAGRDGRLLVFYSPGMLSWLSPSGATQAIWGLDTRITGTALLHERSDRLLLGGAYGLAQVQDRKLRMLPAERFPWLRWATGMIDMPSGETWLISGAGIVRLKTQALLRALSGTPGTLNPTILNFEDGLPGISYTAEGGRVAARGGDGRLWFSTQGGAAWVDPARLSQNKLPPPVAISSLVANGQRFPDPVDVALPKGTSGIQIDFSALSLSIPQRNQVRYRLEGVDDDWVNPGARRQAFYTNLGAGDFVFRVIASNNDGVWNTKGTALKFSIAPTFVETAWFLILCFGALLALLWAAYHFRLRQVTARLQAASEVRIAERERIARELHDTLLQGFQGLVLRFQAVAERIPAEQPVRPLLDQALERADAALIEGRDRVRQLREVEGAGDLAQRLREAAAGLAIGQTACFSLKVEGRVRELHPAVREEMVSIAEEALRNAFRHADAQTIEVALSYRSGDVTLQVSDDGKGIPADILSSGKRSGHFGLVGMRERAARSGGTLAFANLPAGGAQVLLTIPAGTAYLTRRSWRPRFWSRFTTPAKVSPHAR